MKTQKPKTSNPSARLSRQPKCISKPTADKAKTISSEPGPVLLPDEPATEVVAKIDVGYGNQLFIRGQGNGLSWARGTMLECKDSSTWVWSTRAAKDQIVFKLLLNDQIWASGDDCVLKAGRTVEVVPQF